MKHINTYFRVLLLFFTILSCSKTNAQVGVFNITDAAFPTAHNLGTSFPLNISFNWTSSTTSATAVIAYDNTLVTYNAACQSSLPSCMSIIPGASTITITISNLNNCVNTNSINFNVCFFFKCPDSCVGVIKPSVFNGTLTDNFGTVRTSTTTANGILPNTVTLSNSFYSFNQFTSEVTYYACVNNGGCFNIRNPVFHVALSPALGGTITSVYGSGYTYNVSGSNITVSTNLLNGYGCFFYVVKLPCGAGAGQALTSTVNLTGKNCGTDNSPIVTSPVASYTLPVTTVATPNIQLSGSGSSATAFTQTITNNGTTPVNLTITNYLPAVHLASVKQSSAQTGLTGNVKYFDCASIAGSTYLLTDNVPNTNVPAETKKFEHTINNLLPQSSVTLTVGYAAGSSCSGAGTPPYRDSLAIAYNCVAPANSCGTCGPDGTKTQVIVYDLKPQMTCASSNSITGCKYIGDTITLCYLFRNIGTAPLNAGVLNVILPTGLQYVAGSAIYAGFTGTPSVVASSNIKFDLPTMPVSATNSSICLKAVVQPGAVGGSTYFNTNISGSNLGNTSLCGASYIVCTYSSIGVSKRVRGSLDGTAYSLSGQGAPNTPVDFEITLRNTGTVPVDHLEVIDRIPAGGNLSILGNPASAIPNSFNMQMIAVPPSPDYTVNYTATQNICPGIGWSGTGAPCTTGTWSTVLANGGVRFTFPPAYAIPAGGTYVFTFQAKIPAGVAGNLTDCNQVGFSAAPVTGGILGAVQSIPACITTVNPCNTNVTPAFTMSRTCSTGVNVITATALEPSTTSHQWFLMQTNVCGNTTDLATAGQIGTTLTGTTAIFNIPASGCYYIKHRIFITGCYDTTIRMAVILPQVTNTFNFEDANGNVKSLFCVGEAVYFDGSASTGESLYSISVTRRLAGSLSSFSSFVNLGTFTGQAGVLNLSQLISPQYFTSQYEYSVSFTVSNPGDCIGPLATKQIFKVQCCRDFFNPHFQLAVTPAAGSYTMTSALVNVYPYANATSEWYVLSSPNPTGGPYTPVMSTTTTNFSYAGAQYNLYYTVIHKIKTLCGEVCSTVVQYQSQGRNMQEETSDCCLAFQFWPNGPGESQPFTAEFEIGSTPLGGGQYTIDIYPTFSYSSNPAVTHEWYVLSSPNSSGGPYTAVASATGFDYTFSPANDGLYYFIIHKVKGPCGDVCYGQSMCRNCKAEQCDLCGVIDCKILDEVWPDCYPPINLGNSCRKERLYWDAVPAANGYEVELDYNDPACCKSEYFPVVKIVYSDTNIFQLASISHPKFNCIRWRVRAKCKDGFSEWSSWSCYYCEEIIFDPFPLTAGNSSSNTNATTSSSFSPEVFPNPNNGDMYLQMKAKGELVLSVEVFNTQGVLVKSIRENKYPDGNFGTKLNMGSNTPKGLYLVVFKTNFGTYNKKVIIN
jgi:uncharacterized repeat protein (TIGR01451 family)